MDSIKDILKNFNPTKDKYISREFQSFGAHLAQKLDDEKRIALYIRYSKHYPRPVLEKALRFVIDANARNKAALFMWKLKDLGIIGQEKEKPPKKILSKEEKALKKRTKMTEHEEITRITKKKTQKKPSKTVKEKKESTKRIQKMTGLFENL